MEQVRGAILREAVENSINWPHEHMTATGWEAKVLDQARATFSIRNRVRSKIFTTIYKSHTPNTLVSWYVFDFARALLRGTKRYREAHLLLLTVNEQSTLLLPAPEIGAIRPAQYTFFDSWIESHIENEEIIVPSVARRAGENIFVPSEALTEIWRAGVERYIVESSALKDKETHFELDNDEATPESFAVKFKNMFASIARLQNEGADDFSCISDGESFAVNVQHEIADRFHIPPDRMSTFMYQLHQEFKSYVFDGGQIEGRWGGIALKENQITLCVRRNEPRLSSRVPHPILE